VPGIVEVVRGAAAVVMLPVSRVQDLLESQR
jgi:hypothetical protein